MSLAACSEVWKACMLASWMSTSLHATPQTLFASQ